MKMDEDSHLRGAFSTQEKPNQHVVLITSELVAKMNVNRDNSPVYKVGVQDVLSIKIWNDVGLSADVAKQGVMNKTDGLVVQNDGTIFYPYVGNIAVSGKSVEEIRVLLTDKLSQYITAPQVSVGVREYHSKRIHIMGEVQKPGTYPITNISMSILDVAMLGGINNRTADTGQIYIMRRARSNNNPIDRPVIYRFNGGSAESMLLAGQFYLQENDVVFVAPAGVVSWNRVISNILPSVGLGGQLNSINN